MPSQTELAVTVPYDAKVLDCQHLARYTLGDRALERELLQLFVGQLKSSLDQLRSASSASAWRLASHTLKGSAAAIGAAEINRRAAALEARGYDGVPAADDPDLAALEQAGKRFAEAVGHIIG